ncbi:MAG TPA: hypothetical protein PKY20_04185 [Methanothrix sp.]|nr:hypothetical protein [Methanothrix sp.]
MDLTKKLLVVWGGQIRHPEVELHQGDEALCHRQSQPPAQVGGLLQASVPQDQIDSLGG